MTKESYIEEVIKAEYCKYCMCGIIENNNGNACCISGWNGEEERDLKTGYECNPTCDCEKYVFDEDMLEYIELEYEEMKGIILEHC
jgi:hypothetical protein